MNGTQLPAAQVAALDSGDSVLFETAGASSWSPANLRSGTVAKLTAKQVVVHYAGPRGTVEVRFRRDDGRQVGTGYGTLLDPLHPRNVERLTESRHRARQQAIDNLADRWARERDNLDLLRRLQVAISEYLDAEADR